MKSSIAVLALLFGAAVSTPAAAGRCAIAKDQTAAIAAKIAAGHAYAKHKAEFQHGVHKNGKDYKLTPVATNADLAKVVTKVMGEFQIVCPRDKNRLAFADDENNVFVVYNKLDDDCGTVFRPDKSAQKYMETSGCNY